MPSYPVETVPIRLPGLDSPFPLAIRRAGAKRVGIPPAILLHGLGLSSYSWRFVQQRLEESRETIAVDLPGFGRSGMSGRADYSLPGLARSIIALMDALAIDRAPLVGHSLGGGAALIAAVEHPERVEALGLVGSVAYPQPEPPFVTWPRLPLAWVPMMLFSRAFIRAGLLIAYVHPKRLSEDAVREYAVPFRSIAGATAYQRICRALRPVEMEGYTVRFPSFGMPLLILHGVRDNVVPVRIAERLHAAVPGSRLELFRDMGHMLPEEEPDAVADRLRALLAPHRPHRMATDAGSG